MLITFFKISILKAKTTQKSKIVNQKSPAPNRKNGDAAQAAWRKWGKNRTKLEVSTLPPPAPSRPTPRSICIFLLLNQVLWGISLKSKNNKLMQLKKSN